MSTEDGRLRGVICAWSDGDASSGDVALAYTASLGLNPEDCRAISEQIEEDPQALEVVAGDNWILYMTTREKRSGYFRRRKVIKALPPDVLSKIPEDHRPEGPIERSEVAPAGFGELSSMTLEDRMAALFGSPEKYS